jgi:hypothetical protein
VVTLSDGKLGEDLWKTPTLLEGFSGVKARFERIPVAALRARARRTAVHAAAVFSMHDGGPTRKLAVVVHLGRRYRVPMGQGESNTH